MIFIGIDPGLKGAIAALEPQSGQLEIWDMPVFEAKGSKTQLDLNGMQEIFQLAQGHACQAIIEQVNAMPGQGVTSMFRFGECYGALQMALAANRIPFSRITPATWKKYFSLTKNKGSSRQAATERFPSYANYFSRVKDDGRAEAVLIALYGAEKFTPAAA